MCVYIQKKTAFLNVCFLLILLSGLGMYESPLFLATHEEESGGRSVPTTPLQVAAPGLGLKCKMSDIFQVHRCFIALVCRFFVSSVGVLRGCSL